MTICTNSRLVFGILCFVMSLTDPAVAQSPTTQQAFDRLVAGKQMEVIQSGSSDHGPIVFTSPGRYYMHVISYDDGATATVTGDYTYENTDTDTGDLVLTFDEEYQGYEYAIAKLTFTSTHAGRIVLERRRQNGVVITFGTFRIVATTTLSPTTQQAFDRLVAGKLMEVSPSTRESSEFGPIVFTSPGRYYMHVISDRDHVTGNYKYESMDTNVGNLVLTFDEEHNDPKYAIEARMTFTSTHAGNIMLERYAGGSGLGVTFGTFRIVATVPTLPGVAVLLLTALLLAARRTAIRQRHRA